MPEYCTSANMYFEVLSFEPMTYMPLLPAPNCTECDYITQCLRANSRPEITDLKTAGLIEILADYRGHMLYCSGGVSVYRCDPKTPGGHGRAGMPISGDEEKVNIMTRNGSFNATIKFVDFVPMSPMMSRNAFEQALQGDLDDISLRVKGIVRV